mmetsp:Transcript_16182/g.50723  ORF Transcript_16182/g.50723 Transcript_16182/m.50723 type:complete len:166 (+) Transcript_16182:120-617(+)
MQEIIKLVQKSPEVRKEYMLWMRSALLPLHRQAAALIDAKAHLFETDSMTHDLLDYVAMVRSYDVILCKWDNGDYAVLFSPIRYPSKLRRHCETTFQDLRKRQAHLLALPVDPLHQLIHRKFGPDHSWFPFFGAGHRVSAIRVVIKSAGPAADESSYDHPPSSAD